MSRLITILAVLAVAFPAAADTTAIVGGKVHTVGPMGTLENATVLIVDGRIAAVGEDVDVPAGNSDSSRFPIRRPRSIRRSAAHSSLPASTLPTLTIPVQH